MGYDSSFLPQTCSQLIRWIYGTRRHLSQQWTGLRAVSFWGAECRMTRAACCSRCRYSSVPACASCSGCPTVALDALYCGGHASRDAVCFLTGC